jgi:hypothetical protein
MSVRFGRFDREAFRKRLAKVTESELIRHRKGVKEMCNTSLGESPPKAFVTQLEECWAEWRRGLDS